MHIDVEKRLELWYERLSIFRAVATVISAAAILVFLAGLLERLVEPETFTSLGLAYWWAVTTVTTVGYGDIVPESSWGRLVASGLMLVGLGLIPTLTSLIVATLVGKRTLEQQAQLDRQGKEHAAALERIEAHLARLDEGRADDARGQG
jgi:voltage-gated potassium channel